MGLQLIIGGSGTGKSTQLYKMAIERSIEYPDEKILLIVPEQYTMQAQKHIVASHARHGVMNVDILSFERLAYRVFEELGQSQKEILEDTGKSMIIRRLLTEHQDELHAFRSNVRKQGFVDQVKSMISELLQYGVTVEMLEQKKAELGAESVLYGKLQDIQVIYESFLKTVHEKYMTTEEVPDKLCEVIEQSEYVKDSVIFMDDFTGFTPIQYKLMTYLLRLSSKIVMTIPTDPESAPYEPSEMEKLFYLPKDTIAHLEEICRLLRVKREQDILLDEAVRTKFGGSVEIAWLEKYIFREVSVPHDKALKDIEAYELSDPRSELSFVAMKIHEYVSKGFCSYDEIAVVTSDMNRYRNSAQYWFDKYEIPCFFDGRRSISSNIFVEWLRSLLGVFIQKFSYEAMFRYLRSGLSLITLDEADQLENYVLAFGIRNYNRWKKEWTAKSKEMEDSELANLNRLREQIIAPMQELYKLSRKKELKTIELIRGIYRYMMRLHIKEQLEAWKEHFEENAELARAKEYEQIYDVVIDLFERVNLILGQEVLTVREFTDVLEAGMADVRVGIIPPGIDQVTFGDIRRTRLDQVKVLFFVGMNDGLVPLVENGGGLITDPEREKLAEHRVKLAPTARENTCTEQYYLYATLTKPSNKLILTYAAQDASGKEQRISSIFSRILQVFPKLSIQKFSAVQDTMTHIDVNHAYDYLISGLRSIAEDGEVTKEWLEIYDWFSKNPSYEQKTDKLLEAAFYRHWNEKLSQAAVKAVYEGNLTGGVTMLERYASCAYAHFLTYGLKLRERKMFQVQAPDIGMIFHEAIERFSIRIAHSSYEWRDIPDYERNKMVEECVQSVVLEYNHSLMQDSKRAEYLTEKILRMTKRTIWALQEQLKKGDFDPVGYEMRFTTELETDTMKIQYGDEGTLALNGKIDRMDICESDGQRYIKIIDYKSGNTVFDLASVYQGLQLQLMVYMNAAKELEQKNHSRSLVIPAGVLYYHIDDPLVDTDNFWDFRSGDDESDTSENDDLEAKKDPKNHTNPTEEQLKILEKLAVDGLIVDDAEVIHHMDRKPTDSPKVLPISLKKDGSLSAYSSAATPENFEVLSWHVKNKTRELGRRIFSGDISVDPYEYGTKKACDYCLYRPICGFDKSITGYHYRKIKKLKKDEVWNAIMKENGEWDLNGQKNKKQS